MPVYVEVTPALHPSVIEKLPGYEEQGVYVQELREAFSVAYEGIAAIHKARAAVARNPTLNEAAQTLMVAQEATKRMDGMTRKFDGAMSNLNKAIEAIEGDLSRPLAASATAGHIPTEIRAFVQRMSEEERARFLNQAQANNDEQTLAAVLGAPSYLSGIPEAEKAHRVRRYHEQNRPELAHRLELMKRARDVAMKNSPLVFPQIENAIGTSFSKVQALRSAKSEAEQALKSSIG